MKKTIPVCLLIIAAAILLYNSWRLLPLDNDCVRAAALYSDVLSRFEDGIIGAEYTPLTTTLGNLAAKKSTVNPAAAALMVRLLKDARPAPDAVIVINASGSFPGFVFACLSACTVLQLDTFMIASVGVSSYGANIPGNTIADMLLATDGLDYTLLAITPGGSGDRGADLDATELDRIAALVEQKGIRFIRPTGLQDAIALRLELFNENRGDILVNIGGNHASTGADAELALIAGLIKPNPMRNYTSDGLVQAWLAADKTVIQVLNTKKLYGAYNIVFDDEGTIRSGEGRLYRGRQ
jgi:poly-gamma-glutamate system protein